MVKSTTVLLQLLMLTVADPVSPQAARLFDLRPGTETIKPYRLEDSGQIRRIASTSKETAVLTQLPPGVMKNRPKLLGISDFDRDGRTEVFVGWPEIRESGEYFGHLQLYRISTRHIATLVREFQFEDPRCTIYFPAPSQGPTTGVAIAAVLGGAKWSLYCAIFPDGRDPVKLGDAADLKLGDLDGDGTYEWILFQWRGVDLRCSYGFFGPGNSADIFSLSGREFRRIWPPSDWASDASLEGEIRRPELERKYGHPLPLQAPGTVETHQVPWGKTCLVMNRFYDVDGDGRMEIVTITDVVARDNPRLRLSIYKSRGDRFDSIASVDISSKFAPVEIMGIRRLKDRIQILLRLADARKCDDDAHKEDEGVMIAAGFDFKDGAFTRSWVNDGIDITLHAIVRELDHDGEEEVLFKPVERFSPYGPAQKTPMLLRGLKDFLPYVPSK